MSLCTSKNKNIDIFILYSQNPQHIPQTSLSAQSAFPLINPAPLVMSRKWFQETVAELIGSVAYPKGRQKIKSIPNNEEKKGKNNNNNNNNKIKSSLNSKISWEIPKEPQTY